MRSLTYLLSSLFLQHASAFQHHIVSCKVRTVAQQSLPTSGVQYLHQRNKVVAFHKNTPVPLFASGGSDEEDRIGDAADAIQKKVDETSDAFEEKVDETGDSIQKKADETRDSFDKKVDETRDSIQKKVDETSDAIEKRRDETDDAIEEKLEEYGYVSEKKLKGRKKRVIMGYKAIISSYVALAGFVLTKGGISKFPLFFTFGNLSLPIGIAYILKKAAENDRLGSDTYKRLNLGLLQYGLLGGLTVGIAATTQQTNPLAYLPFVLSMINSIKGYAYGVLGWDKKSSDSSLMQDFGGLIKATNQALITKPKTVQSVCYLVASLLVGTLKITKAVDMVKIIRNGGGLPSLSPVLSQYNRLAFLTIALVTLKDACDRDRLSGTTFIQINYLGGLIMAANSAFMGGLTTRLGATAALLSLFLTLSGLSSYLERNKA
ncbi:unnamed protein product [Cylindrotheca closterium]|uniref:Uncharacterized protein n=1 Tax=Cylindrotheca closterium TaxID=2856 RepID=A0AAD2FP57_9STRA|nr:unnamed protein product [Cylindrotheca closterium]